MMETTRFLLVSLVTAALGWGQELSPSELMSAAAKDDESALRRLRDMGSRGNVDAQLFLALGFDPRASKQEEAVYWYLSAAKAGSSVAPALLADLYLANPTMRPHRREVIAALEGPAARGTAKAQLKLGLVYRDTGADDRPYSARDAVSRLVRAGRSEEGGALLALAEMFHAGNGVRRDPAKAVVLVEAGKRLGHPGCRYFLARLRVNVDGVR